VRGFATTPHPKSVGEISASNMHDGNWLFSRTTEPRRLVGGTACVVIGIRDYEPYEIMQIVDWLADRRAGYPKRDLPWHEIGCLADGTPIPPVTIATRSG
jgi:hypothetical protein